MSITFVAVKLVYVWEVAVIVTEAVSPALISPFNVPLVVSKVTPIATSLALSVVDILQSILPTLSTSGPAVGLWGASICYVNRLNFCKRTLYLEY